ncbi:penicillin-binding transpeptidase domain-containing protein [Acanthopleuribacter pedis]|uniref:Penicillin-binding protein transpeptidase domain-containing protein n=1 Tax=Acanthopleuribacter pedis TaxID=442870 RepID=A0A8J7QFL0_9BACT|nr:penicillin-binding transpeptidase domain-containing protein [Acanthopleuribacter pedis]MBO1319010.1 hypothetical protein [Acanthopleuribacter pedis]
MNPHEERGELSGYHWLIPLFSMTGVTLLLLAGAFRNSVLDPFSQNYIEDFAHQRNFETFVEQGLLVDNGHNGVKADWDAFYRYTRSAFKLGQQVAAFEQASAAGALQGVTLKTLPGTWQPLVKKRLLSEQDGQLVLNGEAYHQRMLKTTFGRHFLMAANNTHRLINQAGRISADEFYFRETNVFSVTRVLPRGAVYDRHNQLIVGWDKGRRERSGLHEGVFHVVGLPYRSGIEQKMEKALAPKPHRGLHDLAGLRGRDRRGDDLQLTVDSELSAKLYDMFDFEKKGRLKGAVVLMDIESGHLLASVSSNAPHGETVRGNYDALVRDRKHKPLLNRAWDELHFPGSTYKTVVAAAMLEQEALTQPFKRVQEKRTYLKIRNNRNKVRKKPIDMRTAFAVSSNTYFAEKGVLLGHHTADMAGRLGFNSACDLTLGVKDAKPWITATSSAYRGQQQVRFDKRGDHRLVAQFSLGQNQIKSHPLHMATLIATVANDGVFVDPRLIKGRRRGTLVTETHNPAAFSQLQYGETRRVLDSTTARYLRQACRGTMNMERGTGFYGPQIYRGTVDGQPIYSSAKRGSKAAEFVLIPSAGKTGTAQHGQKGKPPHSWFIGYAPADNPKVAVAVVVEYAGYGSLYALPIGMEALAGGLNSLNQEPHSLAGETEQVAAESSPDF